MEEQMKLKLQITKTISREFLEKNVSRWKKITDQMFIEGKKYQYKN